MIIVTKCHKYIYLRYVTIIHHHSLIIHQQLDHQLYGDNTYAYYMVTLYDSPAIGLLVTIWLLYETTNLPPLDPQLQSVGLAVGQDRQSFPASVRFDDRWRLRPAPRRVESGAGS